MATRECEIPCVKCRGKVRVSDEVQGRRPDESKSEKYVCQKCGFTIIFYTRTVTGYNL